MGCKNEIAELLPWYVNETLSADERRKVESHLKVCPACRESIQGMEWIAGGMEKYKSFLPVEHVSPEKLVQYAEARGELDRTEIASIESHLAGCAGCRDELDVLQGINDDLNKVTYSLHGWRGFVKKLRSILMGSTPYAFSKLFGVTAVRILRKTAFAYLLLLLMLYPAWLGLRGVFSPEDSVPVRTFVLQERMIFRGSDPGVQKLVITPSDEVVRLVFGIPLAESGDRYGAVLLRNGKEIFSIDSISSLDDQGNYGIFLETGVLESGKYLLVVTEVLPAVQGEPEVYTFSFEIK